MLPWLARIAREFGGAYLTALPRILYHTTLGTLLSPRRTLRFHQNILDEAALWGADPVLGTKGFPEFLGAPASSPPGITIRGNFIDDPSGVMGSLRELSILLCTIREVKAKRIFEIGTFVGWTTRLIAMNVDEGAEVFTLDLPQESVAHAVGERFHGSPEAAKIKQLAGDSLHFDFSSWYGGIDFCLVDASHEYEYVAADTRNAFRMVRPGGVILWHDYRHSQWWSGVTRAVREANRRIGGGIFHVKGTAMAACRVTEASKALMSR